MIVGFKEVDWRPHLSRSTNELIRVFLTEQIEPPVEAEKTLQKEKR